MHRFHNYFLSQIQNIKNNAETINLKNWTLTIWHRIECVTWNKVVRDTLWPQRLFLFSLFNKQFVFVLIKIWMKIHFNFFQYFLFILFYIFRSVNARCIQQPYTFINTMRNSSTLYKCVYSWTESSANSRGNWPDGIQLLTISASFKSLYASKNIEKLNKYIVFMLFLRRIYRKHLVSNHWTIWCLRKIVLVSH